MRLLNVVLVLAAWSAGEAAHSAVLKLYNSHSQLIGYNPKVISGKTVLLVCEVSSDSPSTLFNWSCPNLPCNNEERNVSHNIVVLVATATTNGTYTCQPNLGAHEASVTLHVEKSRSTTSTAIYSASIITYGRFIGHPFDGFSKLPRADDQAIQLQLDVAFPFLGKQYDFLQIDTNGHTDFTATEAPLGSIYNLQEFPSIVRQSVSSFGVDLDYQVGDDVHYSLFGINDISLIEKDIVAALERSQEFNHNFSSLLQMALVVTHHHSRYYPHSSSETQVTFQVILAASATVAFAIFNYDYYGIDAVLHNPAVGYTNGSDQVYLRLPDSVVNNINVTVGNTGVVGQWVFRIDQGSIEGHLGEMFHLDCFIDMLDSTGGIQWHRNGAPLTESDTALHVKSSRLVILNFSHSDVGHYECTYNSTGVRGVYVNLFGTVTSKLNSKSMQGPHLGPPQVQSLNLSARRLQVKVPSGYTRGRFKVKYTCGYQDLFIKDQYAFTYIAINDNDTGAVVSWNDSCYVVGTVFKVCVWYLNGDSISSEPAVVYTAPVVIEATNVVKYNSVEIVHPQLNMNVLEAIREKLSTLSNTTTSFQSRLIV